ncbi:MAG TPA: hypothetical protein ENJ86_05835 [Methylothermaceae bacterium]|nr:hypothetical protein [Methylothermaceae bacterium]
MSMPWVDSHRGKFQSNRIYSNAKGQQYALWFFAVLWNAGVWATIYYGQQRIFEAFQENPVFYFFALFPLVGILLVYRAVKETAAWIKFGKTPLIMDPFPGQIGGVVAGYVKVPTADKGAGQAQVSLTCTRHYWEKRGSERRYVSRALWQDRITVPAQPYGKSYRIEFQFHPPDNLPASASTKEEEYRWDIHIAVPMKGRDFERHFVIPVANASRKDIAASARFMRSQPERKEFPVAVEAAGMAVPTIKPLEDGARYDYPAWRNKGVGLVLLVIGIIFLVAQWFMHRQFADFLPVTSMLFFGFGYLISLLVLAGGVFLLGNSLKVTVLPAGVKVQRNILGLIIETEIKASDIADIRIEKGLSSSDGQTSRVWYKLRLLQKDGRAITVGDTLAGSSHAEHIRRQTVANLGEGWAPSDQAAQVVPTEFNMPSRKMRLILKVAGVIISLIFPAALIYDQRELILKLLSGFGFFQ